MKSSAKVVAILSIVFVGVILFYQFVINPTVAPIQVKRSFNNEEILNSTAGTVIGNSNARLTIVEFTDYGCSPCKILFQNFEKILLKSNYLDKGTVKLVIKDVPNVDHNNSKQASIVAMCAGMQGKYWEMCSLLFDRQAEWSNGPKGFEIFKKYAEEIGLDMNEFNKGLKSDSIEKNIGDSYNEFQSLNFPGTPILIIGTTQFNGAISSTEELKLDIQQEINKDVN